MLHVYSDGVELTDVSLLVDQANNTVSYFAKEFEDPENDDMRIIKNVCSPECDTDILIKFTSRDYKNENDDYDILKESYENLIMQYALLNTNYIKLCNSIMNKGGVE